IPLAILDGVCLLIAAIDLASVLIKAENFSVERQLGQVASLGKPQSVRLTVTNRTARRQLLTLKDDVPQHFSVDPPEFLLLLDPKTRTTLEYRLTPRRRGVSQLECVYLRLHSRWRLWQRQIVRPLPAQI